MNKVLMAALGLGMMVLTAEVSFGQTKKAPAATEATPAEPQGKIVFPTDEADLGDLKQGQVGSHTFTFKNQGEAPLIITKVLTTCGCTATEYTREPVAPGKTGTIKVTFDSKNKSGIQNKVITVLSNASNNDVHLTLRANVLPKE